MESNIDQEIQRPVSHEMSTRMLNNLLAKANTSKINETKDLYRLPTPALQNIYCRKSSADILSNVALKDIENANDLILKLEPEFEDFEFENVPLDIPKQLSAEECNQEPKLLVGHVENQKVNKKNGEFILENQHQILNAAVARHKEPFSNQDIPVKLETGAFETSAFEKLHDNVFEDWKIKNEEIEIKEEELEQNEQGILASHAKHKRTPTVPTSQQYDQTRKRNLSNLLQYDRRGHQHIKKSKPDQCEYKTIQKDALQIRLFGSNSKKVNNMLKCNRCEFQTTHKNIIETHLHWHKNPEEFSMSKCDQCEFQTIHEEHLNIHLLRHTNLEEDDMFKCAECEYQTIKKSCFKKHLICHKNPDEVNVFNCDQCEFKTSRKCSLKTHLLRHTKPDEVNKFKCDQCEFQTSRKSYLKTHLLLVRHSLDQCPI